MTTKISIQRIFSQRLLHWYSRNGRDLPWRRTRDPYRIWVSEVMLQQTRVETVIPYYRNFLKQFPTLKSLAMAPRSQVMKTWEGMGYYSRVRNLHEAAKRLSGGNSRQHSEAANSRQHSEHRGKVPDTNEELIRLPGIGRTTAGAILSFAYRRDFPILDGNVKRVLSRVFRIEKDPVDPKAQKELWKLSESLIPMKKGYLFNQAIMELGATVCLPKNPSCPNCCLSRICLAKRYNLQSALPMKATRNPLPHYDIAAGIIWKRMHRQGCLWHNEKILITLRPEKGLLGGLWEFPGGKKEKGESLEECLKREVREELGIQVKVKEPFMSVKHAYTHYKITLHTFHCEYLTGKPTPLRFEDWRWVSLKDLSCYAFPSANRKIIDNLLNPNSPRRRREHREIHNQFTTKPRR